jgi:hypothetical protein
MEEAKRCEQLPLSLKPGTNVAGHRISTRCLRLVAQQDMHCVEGEKQMQKALPHCRLEC